MTPCDQCDEGACTGDCLETNPWIPSWFKQDEEEDEEDQ